MKSSTLAFAFCLALGSGGSGGCRGPSGDQGQGAPAASGAPVTVSVGPAATAAVPGQPLTLVWRFRIARGWHLYGPARNDSGFPPRIDLQLPQGWSAGDLQWPAPERLVLPGEILDHVYHDDLVLLQDVTAPADSRGDGTRMRIPVRIPVRIRWLACREMCVPGDTTLTLSLPVAGRGDPTAAAQEAVAAQARLPVAPPADALAWTWRPEALELVVPGAARLTFIPDQDCGRLLDAIADADVRADRMTLRFRPQAGGLGPARGLLRVEDSAGKVAVYRLAVPGSVGDRPVSQPGG